MSREQDELLERDRESGSVGDKGENPSAGAKVAGLDDLFSRVEADLEAESGWQARLRTMARGPAGALVIGIILGLAVAWLLFGPRADLHLYPRSRLWLELLALGLLSASAGWSFVRPLSRADASETGLAWRLGVHLVAAAAIVSAPAAHMNEPFVSAGVGDAFLRSTFSCLMVGSSVAVPVLGFMLLIDRRGRSGLSLWLAPFAAWMAGMLALQLHCPILPSTHQWAGHAGLLVPTLVLWWLVVRRRARK